MTFSDDFTGADGQRLDARPGWSIVGGTEGGQIWNIQSNGLKAYAGGSGAGPTAYYCTDQGSADQYAQIDLTILAAHGNNFATCRMVDADNWIGIGCIGAGAAGFRLSKFVSGVKTDLISTQGVAGNTYKVACSGTTVQLLENGSQVGSDQTITDFATETTQGFYAAGDTSGSTNEFDNFEAGALGGSSGISLTAYPANLTSTAAITAKISRDLASSLANASTSGNISVQIMRFITANPANVSTISDITVTINSSVSIIVNAINTTSTSALAVQRMISLVANASNITELADIAAILNRSLIVLGSNDSNANDIGVKIQRDLQAALSNGTLTSDISVVTGYLTNLINLSVELLNSPYSIDILSSPYSIELMDSPYSIGLIGD